MLIYTAKLKKNRIIFSIAALFLLCGIFGVFITVNPTMQTEPVSAVVEAKGIKSNEDRLDYLSQFGFIVSGEPIDEEDLKIPKTFDSSFDSYIALQNEQGFDFENYAGKKIKRYTYELNDNSNRMVSLLIYKNKVIGAEVFSSDTGELLQGLTTNNNESI